MALGAGYAFNKAYESFAYALLVGVPIIWLGASISAALSFLIGRFVLKDWVTKKCKDNKKVMALLYFTIYFFF